MIIKKAYNALKIAEQKNDTLLDAIYYISTNFQQDLSLMKISKYAKRKRWLHFM